MIVLIIVFVQPCSPFSPINDVRTTMFNISTEREKESRFSLEFERRLWKKKYVS